VVAEPDARLWSAALWEAAQNADLGLPRKELAEAVGQFLALPRQVVRRRPETGKKERCWIGARLATDAEADASVEEQGPLIRVKTPTGNLSGPMPATPLVVNEDEAATLGDILERNGAELQELRTELGPPGWFEDNLERAKDRAIAKAIAAGVCVYCGQPTTQKDGVCWTCGEQRREGGD